MSRDVSREYGHGGPSTSSLGQFIFGEGASDDLFHDPQPPLPGEQLGGPDGRRYSILGWMGGGGMGQVFRARDEVLGREVALKFLLPYKGLAAEAALSEARAVALLDHENIVRIFDVSEWHDAPGEPGMPVLVMECLEGESLAALLKRELPDVGRALELLDGIAAGLTHAHERQLVHRDLKPSNVFLTPQGTVKLLDFGLSHLMRLVRGQRPELLTSGTPAYMAPEQWRGEPQDARTDIWAVGVMLHEMLTGRRLCPGTTIAQLRACVTSPEPVPLVRTRRPEVPREVEVLLATLLAKDPARRFRSARELRSELHEVRARLRPWGEASRSLVPRRGQVTLVSCQLTGLAERQAPLDDEDVGELETAFHEVCAEVIERNGGAMALSVGGEVLACFGYPQGREEDAERAVRAGLQLARWTGDLLRRRLPLLSLSGLSVSCGIHTDQVAVSARGLESGGGVALTVQGEAPKVTARLARRAGTGGVVIGDTAWKLVCGAFDTEPLGALSFEKLSGTVHLEAHRVLGERKVASRFDRTLGAGRLSSLVGREPELERLLALWERARGGQGAFVLLKGEAGIGKSRLIQELRARVARESALLLRVQCWFRFSTRAPHPAVELLQDLARFNPEDSPPQRLRMLEERLGKLGLSTQDTHLMGQLLSLPIPEESLVHLLTPEQRNEKTFEAVVRLILSRARQQAPVLLVIEDLHWASSTLLEFLGLLLERLEQARVLVVLSARPELQPDWPRRSWYHQLALERLPAGLAETLVKEVAQGHELPEEAVQRLVSRTDGIPLFIEEMTRRVLEGGGEAPIPATLHELLLARLDLLPSRQKTLAQLCALVGRDFSRALLAALTEREDAALGRELAGLVEAGLFQEEEGADGEPGYRFRHALIQEAAAQSLSRSVRRQHHRHIARVLVSRFPEVGEAKPEVLAHHYTEAGEFEPAVHHWLRAGQLAHQRWAIPEAVSHLSLALKLLPGLPECRQRLRMEMLISSALSIPLAYLQGYGSPEMVRLISRARALFFQLGAELPPNALSFWGMLSCSYAQSDFDWFSKMAGKLLEAGGHQHDPELTSVGHRMMATLHLLQGRLREAEEQIERSLACASLDVEPHRRPVALQWTDSQTTSLAMASLIFSVAGCPEKARGYGLRALERAERIDHVHTTAFALTYTAIACDLRREPEEALRLADQALALFPKRSYWFWHLWSTVARGGALFELGRAREGLEPLRQEIERCRVQGIRAGRGAHSLGLLASLHLKLGEFGAGLAALREALTELKSTGDLFYEAELFRLHGELLRAQGKGRRARTRFLRAIDVATRQGAGLFELRATVGLGRLLRELGQPEEAGRLLARACARFEAGGESVDLQEARALLEELT